MNADSGARLILLACAARRSCNDDPRLEPVWNRGLGTEKVYHPTSEAAQDGSVDIPREAKATSKGEMTKQENANTQKMAIEGENFDSNGWLCPMGK